MKFNWLDIGRTVSNSLGAFVVRPTTYRSKIAW